MNAGSTMAALICLLNSSMAVGAAQDSIIQNALTIASADANANLGANRLNTETANRFSETNAAAKTAANAFRATQLNNTEQFNATNKYNQSLSSFDANVRASIAQLDNQFKWDSETRKVALEIMSEAQKMKQKIMIDSGRDFNAATKQKMFTQVDKWVVSTARLTSLASKVPDMATLLKY